MMANTLSIKPVAIGLINTAVLGAVWGMSRLISGSVVVAGAGHGVWTGIAYVLFGFGDEEGPLGIQVTAIYGRKVGVLGLV